MLKKWTFFWPLVLSVLLRITNSDYPFGIFKRFLKPRGTRRVTLVTNPVISHETSLTLYILLKRQWKLCIMCRECGIIKLVGCLIPFVGNKQNMLKLKKRKEKKEIKKNDCKLPLQGNNAILQKWSVFIANKKLLKRKPKPEKIKTIGTAYPSRAPVFTTVFSLFLWQIQLPYDKDHEGHLILILSNENISNIYPNA
jgi:hypothetical protein